MDIPVVDISNKKVGQASLSPAVFETEIKPSVIQDVVVAQMASRRSGTHSTKTRNEVRGGGAKPWKQKGLGKARAGSIRSPIFRGGGITFGPKPRNYSYNPPKKVRKSALKSALSLKAKENALIVIDNLPFEEPKTKQAVAALSALEILNKKTLVVIESANAPVEKSFKNIPTVKLIRAEGVNVYDLLNAQIVLLTKAALLKVEERLGRDK